jgi:hypothetical protein
MSTKMGIWRGALAGAVVLLAVGTASARVIDPTGVTTNESAAIVLYPKLKVDENTCERTLGGQGPGTCSLTGTGCTSNSDCQSTPPVAGVDTLVQLTNTSEFLTKVHCFYTNTNSHCSNAPETICTDANFRDVCPVGGLCVPGWQENDFRLTLTKRQPISWSINQGLSSLPLATTPGQGSPPQFNEGSIPPVAEVPFTGELLCVQVDVTTELPTDRNDLKGEASIVKSVRDRIDDAKYTAIGIKAIEGRQDANPAVLNVGGPEAEYGTINENVDPPFSGCPNVLTVNHFFDGANVVTHDGAVAAPVNTDLTIVPCERDYLTQTGNAPGATIQFLIYNEFEQRFSTSTRVDCYKETPLSDIDTRPGPEGNAYSIFNVGVQGTLTGMSRLRSVAGPNVDGYDARTILALVGENWGAGLCSELGAEGATGGPHEPQVAQLCATDADCGPGSECSNPFVSTDAANVQFQGSRPQGDRIIIPLP